MWSEWTRQELASCARVCRYWADLFQPIIFNHVTICEQKQMTLLHSTHLVLLSKVAQHTAQLTLKDNFDIPFTHCASSVQLISNAQRRLETVGPIPASCGPSLQSIHGVLPRSLPHSSIFQVDRLELQDVHFRTFMDLVRLVRERRTLEYCYGTRLTWKTEVTRIRMPASWMSAQRRRALLESSSKIVFLVKGG